MSSYGDLIVVTGDSPVSKSRYLLQQVNELLPANRVYGLVALRPEVFEQLLGEVEGISFTEEDQADRVLIRVREGFRSCLRWLHIDRSMIPEEFDCVMLDLNLGVLDRVACESVLLPHIEYFRRAGLTVWVTYDSVFESELAGNKESTWFGNAVTTYIEV